MPDPTKPSSFRQQIAEAKNIGVNNRLSPVANSDYEPQIGKGNIFLGGDLDLERAQNMSAGEQTGKFVGNTIANVLTGVGESAGHLYNLATQWGDDRNYDNALLKQMDDWKNPFGEIYRENPEQTFDLADPSWWLNNASGLVSSVGSFAVMGMGVGSLVAKGAGAIAKIGLLTSDAAAAVGETTTAALMSYTEGAMSAKNVFSRVYQKQLQEALYQGLSPEEAHEKAVHMAAQGASTTAQLNTAYGTLLNLGSVAPMFRDMKSSTEFFRTGAGKRLATETAEEYGARLSALSASSPELKKLIGGAGASHLAMEAGKEGFEEVMNQYTEATGEDTGNSGKSGNLFSQFAEALDLQKTWEKTANEEGLLNFMLGAAGGAGQTVLMDHAPTRQNAITADGSLIPRRDEQGNVLTDKKGDPIYEKAWYNSRFTAENKRFQYFDNRREAVLADVKHFTDINNQIDAAVKAGDTAKARQLSDKLMGVHHLNALLNGTAENWIAEYKQYAALDNTVDLGAEPKAQAAELSAQMNEMLTAAGKRENLSLEQETQFSEMEAKQAELLQQATDLAGTTAAMQSGFATSMKDNSYKEKATQAITDLRKASDMYEETEKQFSGYSEEKMAYNLVPTVVAKKLDDMFNTRNIQEYEPLVEKAALAVSADKTLFIKMHADHTADAELVEVHNALNDAIKNNKPDEARAELDHAGIDYKDTPEGILSAARDYKAQLSKEHDVNAAALADMEALAQGSEEYEAYKKANPTKEWTDYVKHVFENSVEASTYGEMLNQLNALKRDTANNQRVLEDIKKNPGKYVRSIVSDAKDALKRQTDLEDYMEAEQTRRAYEGKVFRDNEIARLKAENDKAGAELAELKATEAELVQELLQIEKYKPRKANKLAEKAEAVAQNQRKRERNKEQQEVLQDQIDLNLSKIQDLQEFVPTPAMPQAPINPPLVKPTPKPADNPKPSTPAPAKSLIQQSLEDFNELIDMHGLSPTVAQNELSAYLADHSKFPSKMAQTFVFATQPVQAQLYMLVETILNEINKNTKSAEALAEEEVTVLEDEDELVEDEDEVTFGMRKLKNSPVERGTEKADRELKEAIEGATSITEKVDAVRNPDGSNTIYIHQGEGENPIIINQKPRGKGYSYTVDEGIFQGEVLEGKDAKLVAEQYLQDEGTSLDGVATKMGKHITTAKAKHKAVIDQQSPVFDQDIDETPVEEQLYAASVVMNPNIDLQERSMDGSKRTSAVAPIANHLAYIEVVDKNGNVSRQNATNALNNDANLKVLLPGYLNPGDVVQYHIDTDATATKTGVLMTDDAHNPLVSPQDPAALLSDVGAVPIKITNEAGETIGHVMTVKRLNEMVGGTYANVEVLENFHTDEEVEKAMEMGIRSIDDLNAELITLRSSVLAGHNEGNITESKILNVGEGMLILNTVVKAEGGTRIDTQSASMLLPDPDLELGITYSESVYTKFGQKQEVVNEISISNIGVGALLPGANGEKIFSHLQTNKFSDFQVETMWEAMKLYANRELPQSKQALADLKAMTGFDLSKGAGLRAFISQYYFSPKDFSEAQLVESTAPPTLTVSISDGLVVKGEERASASIRIGIVGMMQGMKIEGTGVTNKVIDLVLPNGSINPEFEQVFKARMKGKILQATHEFNLQDKHLPESDEVKNFGTLKNYRGVNSSGEVTEVVFKDGAFSARKTHKDYNSYIKAHAVTSINGTNKVEGKYVYTVHPQIDIAPKLTTGARVDGEARAPEEISIDEEPQQHPMYSQLEQMKAEFPDSPRSIESVMIEAQAQGFLDEYPEWMGNPFEDC
jgi:hypothetical protein